MTEEDSVTEGDCPFVVHRVTGDNLENTKTLEQKGLALRCFKNGGKVLGIDGHSNAQSIYQNLSLYPQMFPWLFPYGLGGIGSTSLSNASHKRHLLMYHDKQLT